MQGVPKDLPAGLKPQVVLSGNEVESFVACRQ